MRDARERACGHACRGSLCFVSGSNDRKACRCLHDFLGGQPLSHQTVAGAGAWPNSLFKRIFGSRLPLPIAGEDREATGAPGEIGPSEALASVTATHRPPSLRSVHAVQWCPLLSGEMSRVPRRNGYPGTCAQLAVLRPAPACFLLVISP